MAAENEKLRVLSFDMGTVSIGFAVVQEPCKIERVGIINLGTTETRGAVDAMCDLLMTGALAWVNTDPSVHIVMESQPEAGAPKTVSHAIQTYCRVKGIKYEFIAPNDKLKITKSWYDAADLTTRADRKILAMQYCLTALHLEENTKFLSYYTGQQYKQRTDIADAVAQGIRYLQRQKRCSTAAYIAGCDSFAVARPEVEVLLKKDRSEQGKKAHRDEFKTGFRKRKYGEITEPLPDPGLDFNE